jgi:hypothetical protein
VLYWECRRLVGHLGLWEKGVRQMVSKTKLLVLPVMMAVALAVGPQGAALADTTTGNIHIESNAFLVGSAASGSSVDVIVDVTCASTANPTLPGVIHVEVKQPNSPYGPADGAVDRGFFVTPGKAKS